MKEMLPQPNELPTSGKAALRKLEMLTYPCTEVEHLFCDECLQLVETVNIACDHSGDHSKFYTFPIGEQIKHMFEHRRLASVIDLYRDHHTRKDGYICDIVDGTEYRKIKIQLHNQYDLILLWNTDGVSLSGSSKVELWPILCTICEVPPRLRSSFVVVAGVFVHEKKPDMNVFLKPFVASLIELWNHGVSWTHPISKEVCTSKVVAPVLCADAPAKAQVLICKNHNARYGCVTCEQKTKKIRAPEDEINIPGKKKKRRVRRFLYQEEPAQLRSGERIESLGKLAERRGKSRKGILGRAIISDIPCVDRALCICNEYMHLVSLGVVKYFALKIFTESGPWYLGQQIDEIDEFLRKSVRVPDFINRLSRKAKDIKYWKASELRSFLLYYSAPLFKDRLPKKYFQHWLLLVEAFHILLKDALSENDLNTAEILLRSFVRDVGTLYGEICYTYNLHCLLHVCLLVRRWGPVWSTSAFIFESYNGFIGNTVHGTKHLGKELINNIKISQSVAVLENIVNANASHDHHPRLSLTEFLGKPLLMNTFSGNEATFINSYLNGRTCVLYSRAKVKSMTYTSHSYDSDKKRCDSLIQFKHSVNGNERNEFGEIQVFLKLRDNSFHCLIKRIKIAQLDLIFHERSRRVIKNVLPFDITDDLVILPVESISTKVLRIGKYLGLRPNSYEECL